MNLSFKKIGRSKNAFSLVEIILAVAIFSALAAGIALTIGNSTSEFQGREDNAIKERYASEAMEATRSLRDKSWRSISDLATTSAYDIRKASNGDWEFFHGTSTRAGLTRNIYFYDVQRDASGNIVTSGGIWDPNTRKTIVKIEGGANTYQIDSYISDWKAYRINQTDWDGTDAVEVWSGNALSDDIYSYNPAYSLGTTTTGVLTLRSGGTWYGTNWGYRKKITIDNTKVSGSSNLTNFSMLASTTDEQLKDNAHSGNVFQDDGGDIVFVDSNNTKLDYEIEKYDGTTGTLKAWVEIPTLAGATNTDIYIYYGNSTDAGNQWNATGTWSNSYAAVYHMKEDSWNGTAGEVKDSLNAKNATAAGNATTAHNGKIYNSGTFDGSSDYAVTSAAVMSGNQVSYGGWMRFSSFLNLSYTYPISQADASDAGFLIYTYTNSRGLDKIYCWDGTQSTAGYTVVENTWYHIYCVHDGSQMMMYVNGVQQGSVVASSAEVSVSNLEIGFSPDSDQVNLGVNGKIDEVQISSAYRSADWLLTQYYNQSSPSTFYNIGIQATGGGYLASGNATSTAAVLQYSVNPEIQNRDALTLRWSQLVPSACVLDIYLQATNTVDGDTTPLWTAASLFGPFRNTDTSRTTTTIDLTRYPELADKKWIRYGVSMASCNDGVDTPTLYNLDLDVD